MVKFLVEEAGEDIKTEAYMTTPRDVSPLRFLPLHAAAAAANRPVLDFFLTECGMPVDTPTPEWHLTALHILASLKRTEMDLLPIVTWLVEEKGADVTCVNKQGYMAAQMARDTGNMRLHQYLKEQEKRQAARTA